MNVIPMLDRILVKPIIETKIGDFDIPESATPKPVKGVVMAVGPGDIIKDGPLAGQYIQPTCKVGDTVLYSKNSGTEVSIEGEPYMIMREMEVLAII